MAGSGRIRWRGWLAAGVLVVAVVVLVLVLVNWLTGTQLSTADQVASVVAAVMAVAGLPLAVVLARRGNGQPTPPAGTAEPSATGRPVTDSGTTVFTGDPTVIAHDEATAIGQAGVVNIDRNKRSRRSAED